MAADVRWADLRAVFVNLEESKLGRLTRLMGRPVGELSESELNELLELRQLMLEPMPSLSSTIENARRELDALDQRLEELQDSARSGAESEQLGQFSKRVMTARKLLKEQSEADTGIIELLLEGRQAEALSDDARRNEEPEIVEEPSEAHSNAQPWNGLGILRPRP